MLPAIRYVNISSLEKTFLICVVFGMSFYHWFKRCNHEGVQWFQTFTTCQYHASVKNSLQITVTNPHFIERHCPYCESSSIVEKTSLHGSVPNYSPNIWTDSVLVRASPAHTKNPTSSTASNRTLVMSHRVQKEFVVQVQASQQKEWGIPTPVFGSTSSPALEVH